MFIEDIRGIIYSINLYNWADSLEEVLKKLNFPVELDYVCDWKRLIYEKSNIVRYISKNDKKIISECLEIASYRMLGRYSKMSFIAIHLVGNKRLRNERVYEIYRVFRKLFGKYVLFVVLFDDELCFVGTSFIDKKKSEVIISDWFGYTVDIEVMNRISEIDFALFNDKNIATLYGDYLWAISRPYIKYRESKMFLIYGCECVETYETYTSVPNVEGPVPVIKIDRDETFKKNMSYYISVYGDDYFIDDSALEEEPIDIIDEDESDFEWTMLEMELSKEMIEEDEENEEDEYDEDEYDEDDEEDFDDLSYMNPEEMLKHIRGKDVK